MYMLYPHGLLPVALTFRVTRNASFAGQPLESSCPACRTPESGTCGGGDVRPCLWPPRLRGREHPGQPTSWKPGSLGHR